MNILFQVLIGIGVAAVAMGILSGVSDVIQARYVREMEYRRWVEPVPEMLRYREAGK